MIVVCSLKDLDIVCDSIKPSHIISVIDPGFAPKTPKGISNHLKLGFDDIINIDPNNYIFRAGFFYRSNFISLYNHSHVFSSQCGGINQGGVFYDDSGC